MTSILRGTWTFQIIADMRKPPKSIVLQKGGEITITKGIPDMGRRKHLFLKEDSKGIKSYEDTKCKS